MKKLLLSALLFDSCSTLSAAIAQVPSEQRHSSDTQLQSIVNLCSKRDSKVGPKEGSFLDSTHPRHAYGKAINSIVTQLLNNKSSEQLNSLFATAVDLYFTLVGYNGIKQSNDETKAILPMI